MDNRTELLSEFCNCSPVHQLYRVTQCRLRLRDEPSTIQLASLRSFANGLRPSHVCMDAVSCRSPVSTIRWLATAARTVSSELSAVLPGCDGSGDTLPAVDRRRVARDV